MLERYLDLCRGRRGYWRNLHNNNYNIIIINIIIIIIRYHIYAGYLQLCTQTHHVSMVCNYSTVTMYEVVSKYSGLMQCARPPSYV
jgi:hypothetical protein